MAAASARSDGPPVSVRAGALSLAEALAEPLPEALAEALAESLPEALADASLTVTLPIIPMDSCGMQ